MEGPGLLETLGGKFTLGMSHLLERNSDLKRNIVEISQNELATWLERNGQEASGED